MITRTALRRHAISIGEGLKDLFSNVDLHCHSNASDGLLAPVELMMHAIEHQVSLLAITDHDNAEGYRAALKAQQDDVALQKLTLLSGVEFSTLWRGMNIHVVGLGIDVEHAVFKSAEQQQAQSRVLRAQTIAERLAKKGMPDLYSAALSHASSAESIGRPHFAQAMIDMGLVNNFEMAFNKWLGAGKIGDVKVMWPSIAEAVRWISESGGCAVLAHPLKYKMTRTKLSELVTDFVDAGGVGIEVAACQQLPEATHFLGRLALKFGLYGSRGSDFHGSHMPWNSLGRANNLPEGVIPIWEHLNIRSIA